MREAIKHFVSIVQQAAMVALAIVGLGGCGSLSDGGRLFDSTFWDTGPAFGDNNRAEFGLAEMAKGNYAVAEDHFEKALKVNPKNAHALLGLGILYQNTGRLVKSREMYESILAIRPDERSQMVIWKEFSTRPIAEIASVNLALLESGGTPGAKSSAVIPHEVSSGPVSPLLGRTAPMADSDSRARAAGLEPTFSSSEANVLSRFKTLIALRDQGLITVDEFNARRQANIGALLPLTSPSAAAGLDRSVPSADQISGRLRAIGRALEMRAITVGQHSSERTMILDAMMPSAPVAVANPGAPPKGLMEAADAVRKLESLQGEGIISTDEYAKERAAIEHAMQPAPAASSAAAATPAELGLMSDRSGPQPAIHLSSYRSQKAAERGWAQLKRAHKDLLGNLQSEISKIDLGAGKGVFYRLKVGPLNSEAAASELCRKLKSLRQYCEPSFMKLG